MSGPADAAASSNAGTPQLPAGLVSRIRAAYALTEAGSKVSAASMWSGINERKRAIHDALVAGSDAAVHALLANPADTDLFCGFDDLNRNRTQELRAAAEAQRYRALIREKVLALARAVGVEREPNPESPKAADLQVDEDTLKRIEDAIGAELHFPNPFPHEFGIDTARGVVSYRAVQSIYQAWRIRETARTYGYRSVLEIGAGLGRTAYYARHFGITNYTIVDLPMSNVAQAYFLGTVFGDRLISLFGEARSSDGVHITAPGWLFEAQPRFDIALNADSLTEMDRRTAESYMRFVRDRTSYFISINHEANEFTVAELLRSLPFDRRTARYPCWMRAGYVEEIALIQPDATLQ